MDPRKIIKAIIACIFFLFFIKHQAIAQHRTRLEIKPPLLELAIQVQVERTMSILLSKFNECYHFQTSIDDVLDKLYITPKGKASILSFIKRNGLYECIETRIEIPLNKMYKKEFYELRGIKLRADNKGTDFIRVVFDKYGRLSNFGFDDYGRFQYETFLKSGFKKNDISPEYKKKIEEVISQFEKAYNRKDTKYIGKIFSDDAVIVTGTQIKISDIPRRGLRDVRPSITLYRSRSGYVYRLVRQTKDQYLKNLDRLFRVVRSLKVAFEGSPKIAKHPKIEDVFAVVVLQTWKSTTYSDKGFIFLSVDLRQKIPVLKARRWMPEESFSSEEAVQLLLETVDQ